MSKDHEEVEVPANTSPPSEGPQRNAQRGREREFFQRMQPSFAVELPKRPTRIEFLDDSNPKKATIVRRKAREWVNQNRDEAKKARQKHQRSKTTAKNYADRPDGSQDVQGWRQKSAGLVLIPSPLQTAGPHKNDPFDCLPDMGMKYGHLVEYYVSGCPGRSPFAEGENTMLIRFTKTKYSRTGQSRQHSLIPFTSANTVLGNLLHSKVTCSLFLYSIACIRAGVGAATSMTEVYYFYHNSLRELQTALNKESETGVFSDHMMLSLSVIAAIAVFIGMFDTAVMHRNALIRVISIRGDGDILAGLHSTSYWPRETIKWMEILVAIQLIETPRIPYHPYPSPPLPEHVAHEAAQRTAKTLAHLPPVSNSLQHIIHLLHTLNTAFANMPPGAETDTSIAHPLYAAQFSLLQVLEGQKNSATAPPFEILLADTLQLYFVVGPRANPPVMRIFDLLVARLKRALVYYLGDDVPDVSCATEYVAGTWTRDMATNQAIAWSLGIGSIVSAWMGRSEHGWFKGHVGAHFRVLGLDRSEEEWRRVLSVFPATEGCVWLDVWGLWRQLREREDCAWEDSVTET